MLIIILNLLITFILYLDTQDRQNNSLLDNSQNALTSLHLRLKKPLPLNYISGSSGSNGDDRVRISRLRTTGD